MFAVRLARRLVGEALEAVGAPGASPDRSPGRGARDFKGSSPPYRSPPPRDSHGKKEDSPYGSPVLQLGEQQKEFSPSAPSSTSRRSQAKSKAWASDPPSGKVSASAKSSSSSASSTSPGAPLPRLSAPLSLKARRALVPFAAFCGLALGSILGGSLALRLSGKCSASAAECWDLRPRPLGPGLASPAKSGSVHTATTSRTTHEGAAAVGGSDLYGAQGQNPEEKQQDEAADSGTKAFGGGAGGLEGGGGDEAGQARGGWGAGGQGRTQSTGGLGHQESRVEGGSDVQSTGSGSGSGTSRMSDHTSGQVNTVSTAGDGAHGVPLVQVLPDEEDSVLLERAVKALSEKRHGRQQLALLFITRGPLPLAPLWASFLAGHQGSYSILVHTNAGFSFRDGDLPPHFHVRQIRGKGTRWGAASMIDAMRRLLAVALGDPRNTRFVFLSESCIPIYNFTYTQRYLIHTHKSFVRGVAQPPGGSAGITHWSRKYLPLVSKEQWRKGSKWVVLTRRAAAAVVRDTEYYPLFRRLCTWTAHCYPEEHYLQTMLHNVMGNEIENRSVTWVDWSRGGASSMTFSRDDVGENTVGKVRGKQSCQLRGEKAYCYLFARKFRNDTVGPLLALKPQFGFT